MPFLNFLERPISVEMAPHSKLQTLMTMAFETKEATEHAQGLEALLQSDAPESSELRVDYPKGFTIFWKLRDGESRFFLAHPEKEVWVATLALSRDHLEAIAKAFRHSGAELLDLSTLALVSKMSNVEVRLQVRA